MNDAVTRSEVCFLSAPGVMTPLGCDRTTLAEALFSARSGLQPCAGVVPDREVWLGRVASDGLPLPASLAHYDCRNNRLLIAAAKQIENVIETARTRYGRERIAVVIGSSTSGIAEGEAAVAAHVRGEQPPASYHYAQQEIGTPALALAAALDVHGPALTLSTACTSSTLAFLSARRLLRAGLADAVIVGGGDALCQLTVNGFAALASVSQGPCQPFAAGRDGINIGEGAVLFVMSREALDDSVVRFSGGGVASDAYHISAPHPDGVGARAALEAALTDAGLDATAIGYLNLHGTATEKNDAMEAPVVHALFGAQTPCSATKSLTGHLLGAAGAIEAAFCWLALTGQRLVPQAPCATYDPQLPPLNLVSRADAASLRHVLTANYAFGGSNAALIFSRAD